VVPAPPVTEELLHNTFLAFRFGSKNRAEFRGRVKCPVLHAREVPGRVHIHLNGDRLRRTVIAVVLRQERDRLFLTVAADGVELLERETHGIHQAVAAHAGWIDRMFLETLPVCPRPLGGNGRQVAVGAGRRIGDLVAQYLLPDEVPTDRGRGLAGFAGGGEECAVAEESGTLRFRW